MRKTALKRKTPLRKTSKKAVTHAQLWTLARQAVFLRDGMVCSNCDRTPPAVVMQVHHIKPKGSNPALRYVLENLLPVCKGCHMFKLHGTDARECAELMASLVTQARLDKLDMIAKTWKGGRKQDLGLIKIYLEQEIARLG